MSGAPLAPVGSPRSALAVTTIVSAIAAAGIAIWLLPASVHIVDWPRGGPHRVAVFAPLYQLWAIGAAAAAVAIGLLTIGWRRGGMSRIAYGVTPLNVLWVWTVPYWPWLPDRLPLLVALAGPMRWVFATLAILNMAGRIAAAPWRVWSLRPGRRTIFAVSLVIYLWFGLRALAVTGLGGDEPHYLVITHSLLVDGDLQIENNHAEGHYRPFFNGELRPDYLMRGSNGAIYSIHAPGLSVLLLPGYAVAGARGAVVTVCLFAALAALAVFEIAAIMAGPGIALAVWAVVCLSVPFIPHAWGLFPEMAGTALVAWAIVWGIEAGERSSGAWAWRGCCLAWLPWLHTKFSVLLAGVTLFLLWRLRHRWATALALVVPIGVSGVAWLASFYIIYGSVDPQVPYGDYTARFVRMENVPRSLLGLLFDQKFGFLVYAPAFVLALPGFWTMARNARWRAAAIACVGVVVAFTLSTARLYMWWGGSSAPARFLVPLAPLLAPALAAGLASLRGKLARATWAACAVVSVCVGIGGALGTRQFLLFSEPHGFSRILVSVQGSAPLAAALPTFTQPDWMAPAGRLLPWAAALAVAVGAGWLAARLAATPVGIVTAEACGFAAAAALFVPSFPAEVRAEARTRGDLELMERFDPVARRAFDYSLLARLSPPEWLQTLNVIFDRAPGSEPDGIGRLTSALHLPPGEYDARVWFEGGREQSGALQATVGYDNLLARLDAPLPNPAVLGLSLPVAVPAFWLQLTDLDSARAVRRLEIVPRSVEPASARTAGGVIAVEAIPGWMQGYIGYLGGAYAENGVFWTHGTEAGQLLLVPAGASTAALIVHVGPRGTGVRVTIGGTTERHSFKPNETKTIRIALPAGARVLPVEVQADAWFRPADVDPTSTDARQLGCQVRLVLE